MKKVIILLSFILILCLTSCTTKEITSNVATDDETVQKSIDSCYYAPENKDYLISNYEKGVCINRYYGSDTEVVIPETLDGKSVVKIGSYYEFNSESKEYFASTAFDFNKIKTITLSKDIQSFDSLHNYNDNLEKIYVDTDNLNFTSINGLLYSKDQTTLITIPANYKDKTLKIPENTKTVCEIMSKNSESIVLPKSLEKIDINFNSQNNSSWYYNSNEIWNEKFKSISVSSYNKYFSSIDGVLYNKDVTELLIYPNEKEDTSLIVPNTVEIVDYFYLNSIKNIRTIEFGKNIKKINITTDFDWDSESQSEPKPIVIKGYKGSTAESWSKAQHQDWWEKDYLTFVALD